MASNEDNANKEQIRVYQSNDSTGDAEIAYDVHWRHYQLYNNKQSLREFKESQQYARLREQTKRYRPPNGIEVGAKLLCKCRCPQCASRGAPVWHRSATAPSAPSSPSTSLSGTARARSGQARRGSVRARGA
mmetsp:Transcript_4766/g.15845  ORF Transcript_4766/g.15845 Transcript_4766/m.15845 type:complete len:132 (-) Transcript_4766:1060-1455(-)